MVGLGTVINVISEKDLTATEKDISRNLRKYLNVDSDVLRRISIGVE